MKKSTLLILFMVCSIIAKAQQTSMVIDNQTPGWLSSKINYGDQLTVENLTVTGYINGSDIKFIRQLNQTKKLNGVLNLENASIVLGGEAYYHFNGSPYTTKDNTLTDFMFADLDSLKKVILPQTLKELEGGHQFMGTYVDTLIINGQLDNVYIGYSYNSNYWKTKCIYIPEGVKHIDFGYLFRGLTNKVFHLPSTLQTVDGMTAALAERNLVFHCSSTNPENIKVVEYTNNNYSFFDGGTIYVPEGTAEKYRNSIFRKLTIIEDVAVKEVKFNEDSIIAYVGDIKFLKADVYPSKAIHKEILYLSSNEDILKVTANGEYTCHTFGEVQVYAYSYNREASDICKVKIYEHTTGVDVEPNVTIKIGEVYALKASTLPLNTSDNRLIYTCDNNSVLDISNKGIILGKRRGSAIITITSADGGYTAHCMVKVIQPVTSVSLETKDKELKVGESYTFRATIAPYDADNKSIIWTSENPEIVTVENGTITALKSGIVKITATSEENSNITDFCEVTVTQPVAGITLNHTTFNLEGIGDVVQLEATITPEDATNKKINWKSSNENVCVVSNGKVVAVGYGTAVIIATTADGGRMATCTIVVEDATGINEINTTNEEVKIYDVQGRPSTLKTKGVKIIRFADGTSMKIVIK